MDEQQARFILQSGTPRPGDAEDPTFQEAAALAERDPALREWVKHQDELTRALDDKFNEIPVPPELRDRILAGCAVSTRRARVRRRQWLAMAAGFTVLLTTGLLWQFQPLRVSDEDTFASLRRDMTQYLSGPYRLERYSPDLPVLKTHLAAARVADFPIPAGLTDHPSIGCRTIDWREHRVALICFSTEGEVVHLMVIPREALRNAPGAARVSERFDGWTTAGWSDDRFVYLTVTPAEPEHLSRLLDGPA